MEHLRASEYGYILELSLSDGFAVVADDGKLGLSVSRHLHDGLKISLWLVHSVVFLFSLVCLFSLSIFIYDLTSY